MAKSGEVSESSAAYRALHSPAGETHSRALLPTKTDRELVPSHLVSDTSAAKTASRISDITAVGDYNQAAHARTMARPAITIDLPGEDSREGKDSPLRTLPEGVTIKNREPAAELEGIPDHPHQIFPPRQEVILIAGRNGETLGSAQAHVVTTFIAGKDTIEPDTHAVLRDIDVRPDKRKQNIGSTLLSTVEEQARASGATRVEGRIRESDPGYLHGPEFLVNHGYTVTQDRSGFSFRKLLDDNQHVGEMVDLRGFDDEPELSEREAYVEQAIGRAKILSHDEYYRHVEMYDLAFADIGSTYFRGENRIVEEILINHDNLHHGWGQDFTHLTDVILEEKAEEMWLTKDLSPDDHEGYATAHRQAIDAAVEKAHTDGLLGDFLELRKRQLHTFAEKGNPQALDELALYENAAEQLSKRINDST